MRGMLRVEIIGRSSLASFPVRIRPIFMPHAVLAVVIVIASGLDLISQVLSWFGV